MDPCFRHWFTCILAGPTGAGKTVWVKRFLNNIENMMTPLPEEVVWCYGEWQSGYNTMKNITFVEGLPKTDEWTDGKRRLVILDDLMSEADERVTKLFTKECHHRNLSVMFIVQNLFGKNKEQRTKKYKFEQSLFSCF